MRLKELYKKEILPKLQKELELKNYMSVPRILKVSINIGFGKQSKNKELIKTIEDNLLRISGQKPSMTKSKKAVSAFKIREGMIIGAKVTLRDDRMYDFVEKLVNIYFPQVRDFRGVSEKAVDNRGNITIGFKEVSAFPEIATQEIENSHGLEISITTSAKTKKQGLALFKMLNFPFKKN